MAEYLILIYSDETARDTPESGSSDEIMKGHQRFGERNAAALRGGNALQPTSTATSLRPDSSGGSSSPTVRSPRPRKPSVATTSWRPPTWTRPWR